MDGGKKKKGVKNKAKDAAESGAKKIKLKAVKLCPGTKAHKAQRWKEYNGDWDYEHWSNVYEANMTKASKSREAVEAYREVLGWGKLEVTVLVEEDVVRRLDIADKRRKRAVEHKTGYICLTEAMQYELERDELLVDQGWTITWHFERSSADPEARWGPSGPLEETLKEAGIKITKAEYDD